MTLQLSSTFSGKRRPAKWDQFHHPDTNTLCIITKCSSLNVFYKPINSETETSMTRTEWYERVG